MKIIFGFDFTIDLLEQVMELDKISYEKQYVGELKNTLARYAANQQSFVGIMKNDKLIGYINFFPTTKELWNDIICACIHIRDDDILPTEIAPYSVDIDNKLYILSVVISPEYRDSTVIKLLWQGFCDYIEELEGQGFNIKEIAATAVSHDGKKFLQKHGFKAIRTLSDNNIVYHMSI